VELGVVGEVGMFRKLPALFNVKGGNRKPAGQFERFDCQILALTWVKRSVSCSKSAERSKPCKKCRRLNRLRFRPQEKT